MNHEQKYNLLKMICPECKKLSETSKFFPSEVLTTDIYYSSWYDEEGRQHIHDDNVKSFFWVCSNKHKGTGELDNRCWCGWIGNVGFLEVKV